MNLVLLAALVASVTFSVPAPAQSPAYPSKPVRVVLGYTSGGTADVVGRLIAERLSRSMGQPVLFDNRPGASGNIAAQFVAGAPADGYTLLLGAPAEMVINPHARKDASFDPLTAFTPIALAFEVPLGLIVPSMSTYLTLTDLLDKARREPGSLMFANSGNGSPAHMANETLAAATKTVMTQVPYKGGAPAMTDLIAGRVDAYFLSIPGAMPHVKSGNVRIIGVSTSTRSSVLPDVPTLMELGVPDFNFSLWGGFFAPAGTPDNIVRRLNQEITAVFSQPDVQDKMAAAGASVAQTMPEEFGRFVRAESVKYAAIIKRIDYKGE